MLKQKILTAIAVALCAYLIVGIIHCCVMALWMFMVCDLKEGTTYLQVAFWYCADIWPVVAWPYDAILFYMFEL